MIQTADLWMTLSSRETPAARSLSIVVVASLLKVRKSLSTCHHTHLSLRMGRVCARVHGAYFLEGVVYHSLTITRSCPLHLIYMCKSPDSILKSSPGLEPIIFSPYRSVYICIQHRTLAYLSLACTFGFFILGGTDNRRSLRFRTDLCLSIFKAAGAVLLTVHRARCSWLSWVLSIVQMSSIIPMRPSILTTALCS